MKFTTKRFGLATYRSYHRVPRFDRWTTRNVIGGIGECYVTYLFFSIGGFCLCFDLVTKA